MKFGKPVVQELKTWLKRLWLTNLERRVIDIKLCLLVAKVFWPEIVCLGERAIQMILLSSCRTQMQQMLSTRSLFHPTYFFLTLSVSFKPLYSLRNVVFLELFLFFIFIFFSIFCLIFSNISLTGFSICCYKGTNKKSFIWKFTKIS